MHCGDQRHLGLCLGYVPALAYGSCRVSDQGTTLRASDLHNARATILNPFNLIHDLDPSFCHNDPLPEMAPNGTHFISWVQLPILTISSNLAIIWYRIVAQHIVTPLTAVHVCMGKNRFSSDVFGSGNGSVPNRRQGITWTRDDQDVWWSDILLITGSGNASPHSDAPWCH